MLNPAGLRAALIVAGRLRGVVVVACLCLPWADGLRVKRPVRNVDAAHAIDERTTSQLSWCQPLAGIPSANLLANLALADFERQQTLRPDGRFDFGVINERWRSAKLAILADPLGIEHRNRLAALTLHGSFLGQPAARLVG